METRLGRGIVLRLDGTPWISAVVRFELVDPKKVGLELAPGQKKAYASGLTGLLEAEFIVGGHYRCTLPDGRVLDFVVPTGTGYFDFWATLGQPPAAEYPTFVRKNGDTLAGDLDFAGNEIQGARIGPSNVIQSPVLSDRPAGLEPGQVAYSADGQTYWLGIGTSESYGVDGSQVIPSPPAGKGWREFSLLENGGPNGNSRSVSWDVADADLVGNLLVLVHGLGTNVVDVSVRDASGNAVFVENHILSANAVSLSFEGLRPLANPYTVLVEA